MKKERRGEEEPRMSRQTVNILPVLTCQHWLRTTYTATAAGLLPTPDSWQWQPHGGSHLDSCCCAQDWTTSTVTLVIMIWTSSYSFSLSCLPYHILCVTDIVCIRVLENTIVFHLALFLKYDGLLERRPKIFCKARMTFPINAMQCGLENLLEVW